MRTEIHGPHSLGPQPDFSQPLSLIFLTSNAISLHASFLFCKRLSDVCFKIYVQQQSPFKTLTIIYLLILYIKSFRVVFSALSAEVSFSIFRAPQAVPGLRSWCTHSKTGLPPTGMRNPTPCRLFSAEMRRCAEHRSLRCSTRPGLAKAGSGAPQLQAAPPDSSGRAGGGDRRRPQTKKQSNSDSWNGTGCGFTFLVTYFEYLCQLAWTSWDKQHLKAR